MRPLAINDAVRADIRRVIAYAEAHRVSLADMHRHAAGELPAVGDNPNHACIIPVGFRCVFSIEHHPGGLFRHLSVSTPDAGRAANLIAMGWLSKEFGFVHQMATDKTVIAIEPLSPGHIAINVLEPYEDPQKN